MLALKERWFDHSPNNKKRKENQELSTEERGIIELCKNNGKVTNEELQDLLGVHRNTATVKLKDMVSRRLLIQKGNGRHTYYILTLR